jgi:hypothetical protein
MNATPLGTDSCLNEGAEMTGNDPTEDEPSTLDNGALSEMTIPNENHALFQMRWP